MTNDAYHITAPEPEGRGHRRGRSPRRCGSADLSPADIGHVNAHATSTPVGDMAESKTILRAIGDHPVVTATKSMTGHMLGAAGAVEAIATVLAVRDDIVPGTRNIVNLDPEIKVDVATENRKVELHAAVNDSFGFGGHNVALVFTKLRRSVTATVPTGPRPKQPPPPAAAAQRLPPGRPRPRSPTPGAGSGWPSCSTPTRWSACIPSDTSGVLGGPGPDRRRPGRSPTAPTPPGWAVRWAGRGAGTSSTPSTRPSGSGFPVIGLWHSGGARLAEGVEALDGVGQVFAAMVRASGRVPQISVVLGAAAGGAAYGPALTDIVIMSPDGRVFVTGPEVVKSVTGEQVDMEALGGPSAHGRKSGVVHIVATTEDDAYVRARRVNGLFARPGIAGIAGMTRRPGAGVGVAARAGQPGLRRSSR